MTFSTYLGDQFLVVGSTMMVDVIQVSTGKVVHVFETRKEKVKSLSLLFQKANQLVSFSDCDIVFWHVLKIHALFVVSAGR